MFRPPHRRSSARRATVASAERLERRDCPATFGIVGSREIGEAGGTAALTVQLSERLSKPVTVDYLIQGTATAGRDYRLTSGNSLLAAPTGRLTFAPGQTVQTVSVGIVNDQLREGTETLSFTLFKPRGATLAANRKADVAILDDDNYTAVIRGPDRLQPASSGTYRLVLSAPATQLHTFHVSTEDRSAFSPSDYAALTRLPLTFSIGETTKSFSISTRANSAAEADETFAITVTPPAADFPAVAPLPVTIAGDGSRPPLPPGPPITTATFTHEYGWGITNASASVAKLLGRTTAFPEVRDLGGVNWGNDVVRAPEVWAQGYTGKGIVVAVVDSGVDYTHPALRQSIWVNPREIAGDGIDNDRNGFVDDVQGWDFADNDNDAMDEVRADGGHGTHVAGTIVSVGSAFGPRGVAYESKVMPIRVLGEEGRGTDLAVANGIRYAADNGAHVINLSLGFPGSAGPTSIREAVTYATSRGVVVVAAAGNDREPTPSFPASLATLPGVLSVGAITSANRLWLDEQPLRVVRPNGSVTFVYQGSAYAGTSPTLQHVVAPGAAVTSTVPTGYTGGMTTSAGTFFSDSGTSMAAPHVSGIVALMLSALPNARAPGVRDRVVSALVTTSQQPPALSSVAAASTAARATGVTSVVPSQRVRSASFQVLALASSLNSMKNTAATQAFASLDAEQGRGAGSTRSLASTRRASTPSPTPSWQQLPIRVVPRFA